MHKKINSPTDPDSLFERAIAADRANIPQLPIEPDSSLVAQLKSAISISSTATPPANIAATGFLAHGLGIAIAILSAGFVGVLLYFFPISSSKHTAAPEQNSIMIVPDSNKKNDSITPSARKQTEHTTSVLTSREQQTSDTVSIKKQTPARHSKDLLSPISSKTSRSDSITVPLK